MASGNKMKSNSGAAKRFRKTKNGKIKRDDAYLRHLRRNKSTKQKRRLRQPNVGFSSRDKTRYSYVSRY